MKYHYLLLGLSVLLWSALAASIYQPWAFLAAPIIAWLLSALAPRELKWHALSLAVINGLGAFLTVRSNHLYWLSYGDNIMVGPLIEVYLRSHTMHFTLAALVCGALASFGSRMWWRGWRSRRVCLAVLALIAALMVAQAATICPGFFHGMDLDSGNRAINNDTSLYRQVYRAVCQGQPAYSASAQIHTFYYIGSFVRYVFGYRLPTVFMLWKYCTWGYGMGVTYLFILLTLLAMWSVFRTLEYQLKPAPSLVAPILLGPLFFMGPADWSLLMTEYWGMFPFIFSLPFLVRRQIAPASFFLVLAAITREFLLLPALLFLIVGLLDRELRPRYFIYLPLAVGGAFLACHVFILTWAYQEMVGLRFLEPAVGEAGGLAFIMHMLRYPTIYYAGWLWTMFLVILGAIAGWRIMPRSLAIVLAGTTVGFCVFAAWAGKGLNFYWGIIPLTALLISCGYATALLKTGGDDEEEPPSDKELGWEW